MLDSLTIFEDFFTLSNCSSCSRKSFFMSAIFCRCMHRVRDARWLLKYRNEFQRLKVESIQLVGVREDIHRRAETSELHLRQIREINIIFQYSQNHCVHAFENSRSCRISYLRRVFYKIFSWWFFLRQSAPILNMHIDSAVNCGLLPLYERRIDAGANTARRLGPVEFAMNKKYKSIWNTSKRYKTHKCQQSAHEHM